MTPFDIIGQLCSKELPFDSIDENEYNSFLINRGMSYFIDTVMLSNLMNIHPSIPKSWQYDFYNNTIKPKKKRFSRWAKSETDDTLDLISSAYNINYKKASEIRKLLTENDIEFLREKTFRGGR